MSPVTFYTTIPLLDIAGHMSPDDLYTRTVAVGSNTAPPASCQDVPCSGLGILRKGICLQKWRMCDDGHHLPDEGDGLVTHCMGISYVGFDHIAEWLLHSLIKKNLSSIAEIKHQQILTSCNEHILFLEQCPLTL